MDSIAQEALAALDTAVAALMPATVPGGLTRDLLVAPLRIAPAGMGGYVGSSVEPAGSLLGRRIEATVRVAIRGGQEPAAMAYLNQVVRALQLQDRAAMRRAGIFRISSQIADARHAELSVLFEYIRQPSVGEGVIEQLDFAIDNNPTRYKTRFSFDVDGRALVGQPSPLAEFAEADDPDVNAGSPDSQWSFNNAAARIEQNAAVRGGPLALSQPKKAGAQLLWRPEGHGLSVSRFIAGIEFESSSEDGIGCVFARQDDNNFFYFLASQRHRYHLFGRKLNGVYSVLGAPNLDAGFALNRRNRLRLFACDGELNAELDGVRMLSVSVDDIPSGEVGFLTHGNNRARFHRAKLIELF